MTKLSLPVGKAGQRKRGWIPGVHRGIDYGWYNADPTNSQRIFAAAPGRVVKVENNAGWNRGFGNRVWIEHAPGVITGYNHFWNGGIVVRVGQVVNAGHYLGQMGDTGDSDGVHVHFELWLNGDRVDPAPYFSKNLPGTPTPASGDTTPFTETEEEDEMKASQMHYKDSSGKTIRCLFVPGTAYFLAWQESGATIANGFATSQQTTNSIPGTKSMVDAIKRAAEALLPASNTSSIGDVTVKIDSAELTADIAAAVNDEAAKRLTD